MRPLPRVKQQPLRNTSPPLKELINTSSSGCGISKYSPYISCCGITKACGTPAAMGWPGLTVQTTSRSSASRQRREQLVPISCTNGLERSEEHTSELQSRETISYAV